MPFYRFIIHGADVNAPKDSHGFYTTRAAFAATQEGAARKVLAALSLEFTTGVSAPVWRSAPPALTIEKGWRIGFHQLRSAPNRGSTFYGGPKE